MSQGTESEHSLTFIRCCTQSTRSGGNLVFLAAIAMLAVLSGCGGSYDGDESHKINGSIDVPAGKPPGAVATVNGSDVTGALSNVNGEIALTGAHVGGGIKTVNGGMSIGGASRVEGGILVEKSNGGLMQIFHDVPRIVIGPGATVQGDLRFERTVKLFVSDKATVGTVTGTAPIPFTGDAPPK